MNKNLFLISFTILLTFLFSTFLYTEINIDKTYKGKIIVFDNTILISKMDNKKLKNIIKINNSKKLKNGIYTSNIDIENKKVKKIYNIRETFQSKIYKKTIKFFSKSFKNTNIKNLYLLLFWGYKENISKKFIFLLSEIGLLHIIVISGLHYNILKKYIAKIIYFFDFNKYLFNFIIFCILSIFTYVLYGSPYQQTNYSISRCFIMYLIWFLNYIFKEAFEINKAFKLSVFYTIITNLYDLNNASLILTYIITFNVIYTNNLLKKVKNVNKKYILFNLYIYILNIPVTIYFFKKIYIYQLLTNILFSFIIQYIYIIFFVHTIICLLNIKYILSTSNFVLDNFYSLFTYLLNKTYNLKILYINFNANILILILIYILTLYILKKINIKSKY